MAPLEPRDLILLGPLMTLLCLFRYSSMGEVLFTRADCRRNVIFLGPNVWVRCCLHTLIFLGPIGLRLQLAEPNGKQITSHSSIIRGAYWVKVLLAPHS